MCGCARVAHPSKHTRRRHKTERQAPARVLHTQDSAWTRGGTFWSACVTLTNTPMEPAYTRLPIGGLCLRAGQVSNRTQHVARSMGPRFYGVKSTSWHDDKDEEDAADSIAGISAARRSTAISTNPAAWPPTTAIMIHTLKDMTNSMQM